MKLTIGENIRNYRKKNDLTQEVLAERLGVTYQSISRWENGATYPDLELLPSISETLGVTVDELLGIPQIEKEKRAEETCDELQRECAKVDYDADRIITILRDIRRNYLDCESAWRPWSHSNSKAFRDSKILPEVRLLAEARLAKEPMCPCVIQIMAEVEDEEHLDAFLAKHTTAFDCSERALRFLRYWRRWECDKYEEERRFALYQAFNTLLSPRYFNPLTENKENEAKAIEFMETLLAMIRDRSVEGGLDTWVDDRLRLGVKSAASSINKHQFEEAIAKITSLVELLETTMRITDEIKLSTSCRFLDGMVWTACEQWHSPDGHPDTPEERMIYVKASINRMVTCYCIYPSEYWKMLRGKDFELLHGNPMFESLCERVKVLIITR